MPAAARAVVESYLQCLVKAGFASSAYLKYATPEQIAALLPTWLAMLIAVEDMKAAYRQCPVAPCDLCFTVVAFWDCSLQQIMFVVLLGHPFGLSSAVLNFNRTFPALARFALCCRAL